MSLPSAASALLSPSASTLVSAFAAVVLSVLEEPHPVKDAAAIHPASPKAAARLMVALVKMCIRDSSWHKNGLCDLALFCLYMKCLHFLLLPSVFMYMSLIFGLIPIRWGSFIFWSNSPTMINVFECFGHFCG